MPEFTFSLVVEGIDVDADADVSAFFEAGCDDATLAARGSQSVATFSREASSPHDALWTAIRDISSISARSRVIAVDLDLVTTADVAGRLDVSPETVRTWSGARPLRGAGPFPPVVGIVGQGVAVWRWGDIVDWLREHMPTRIDETTLPHDVVCSANAALAQDHDPMDPGFHDAPYDVSLT